MEEAEKFFLSALQEAKEGFGERDPHVASACNNLVGLLFRCFKYHIVFCGYYPIYLYLKCNFENCRIYKEMNWRNIILKCINNVTLLLSLNVCYLDNTNHQNVNLSITFERKNSGFLW